MSGRSPVERSMMSSASSITSRLRRPRKSIFSRPICSIGFIENWVTVRNTFSPFSSVARVGELQRHDVGQRAVGDHDRGGVDRGVADDPLEALGDVDDLLAPSGRASTSARSGSPGFRQSSKLGGRPMIGSGISFASRSPVAVVVAEHARGVARRRAREHLAERDDLRDRLLAVLLGHVADHALAAADREVDVDVRHRHALGVEEALEQQVVAQRIDVGDLQRSRRRSSRRPSRGPGRPRSRCPWRT